MKDMIEYKGYFGSVHYSGEDEIFHGKIEFIRSLVTFEGTNVEGLHQCFEEAVDDYLELCKKQKIDPEKPFKGSFNVRTGTELHRLAALTAHEKGSNINQVVIEALKNYLGTE
jgi:predicted HicB family RNase H-like nuclease